MSIIEIISVIVVGLIGGVAVGIQGPMSGAMSARLGPLVSSLIIHVGGTIATMVLLLFSGGVNLRDVGSLPRPFFFAGVFGVILYLTLAFTLPRVGTTVSVALLVLAQLIVGMILDHFGWMGVSQHSFNGTRLLGVALLVGGTYLVTR